MARDAVVRLGNADGAVDAVAAIAAHQERGDAGGVGLEGHGHQVEHQAGVLFVGGGDAGRGVKADSSPAIGGRVQIASVESERIGQIDEGTMNKGRPKTGRPLFS